MRPTTIESIYNTYSDILYTYAMRRINNPDVAKDLVHNIFLSLMERGESAEINLIGNFLTRSMTYQINRYLRKESNRYRLIDIGTHNQTAENEMIFRDLSERYKAFLVRLPKRHKNVFRMRFEKEAPLNKIAKKMGITQKTVNNICSDTRKRFKESLISQP